MSKELEAFHRICVIAFGDDEPFDDIHDVKEVEKSLKALEIIKEQNVNTWAFQESKNAEEYNLRIEYNRPQPSFLTQEEYELLKEVLL